MKTQLRIRSLSILAVSATIAASINMAVIAQPNPERTNLSLTTVERLDIFADHSAENLKYIAPDDQALNMEQDQALNNLELFTDNSGSLLKYIAPVEFEDQINQELNALADNLIGQLEYRAPVYDEFTNTFDKPVMTALKANKRPVIADEYTSQEAWLINAGYYKASGKALLHKMKSDDISARYDNKL